MKGPLDALAPRELQVLEFLATGLENKEIARRMEIGEATVKGYVAAIFDTLGVHNRTEAAAVWHQRNG